MIACKLAAFLKRVLILALPRLHDYFHDFMWKKKKS